MPLSTRLLRLLPLVLLTGFVAIVVPAAQPPASAYSTYHCDGYEGCRARGYSDAGYGAVSNRMYWRMYGGHNCTNYIAYRMIQAGMSTERPWSGSGNAAYWGVAMSRITDSKPAVGAVAWWKAGVPGAGSSGHVAYIEKVVSPTEILVSEDSWSGTFHWRTITKEGTGWPSGFIHFVDKTVKPGSLAPRINGTAQVGSTLTAGPGRWKPGTAAVEYQWLADNAPIKGATDKTLDLDPSVLGKQIAVQVTASQKGYTPGSAVTGETKAVTAGVLTGQAAPTVSGTPELDGELTATPGTWSPKPDSTTIRWKADGKLIAGRNGPTLQLDDSLVGKRIAATEIVRRSGFTKTHADSEATTAVVAGVVELADPFTSVGISQVGRIVGVEPGTVSPADATVKYGWLRDGVAIQGADQASYQVMPADLGHTLTVRVVVTKKHYRGLARVLDLGTITTLPRVGVVAKGAERKALVWVTTRAPGLETTGGSVTVTVGSKSVTKQVTGTRTRLTLRDLAPGQERTVKVSYSGTELVEPGSARSTVHVTR